jgi:SAM-dependent methyltransferase
MLAEAEAAHFWFRARNAVLSAMILSIVRNWGPGYRVLEIGCGTGFVLRGLERVCEEGVLTGMDLFSEGLMYARRRVCCGLVQGDMTRPPFAAPFDVVGMFDVLEHLKDDLTALRRAHGMLTDRGALVLTVPGHASLWSYFDDLGRHCRRYEVAELRDKLARAGLQVGFLSQFMMPLFPILWLGRRTGKRRHATVDAQNMERAYGLFAEELRIRPLTNGILTFLLSQEAHLLRRRIPLPIGSSILAVAHRPA